ncbi:hypothetical protein N7447_001354 [Penicillium robsamsonii]|uniref:uncharacterized protein n=1 Tax=Penicillium robsamsonii TaxID=1792511 RepID=UPI002547E2D3|nr:uncharacterized protein N7447_001354 [Penicillium robsamsonii]KAJ5835328.1 hypothetical protein N7447_001354 [Penicillium robsamsonii]
MRRVLLLHRGILQATPLGYVWHTLILLTFDRSGLTPSLDSTKTVPTIISAFFFESLEAGYQVHKKACGIETTVEVITAVARGDVPWLSMQNTMPFRTQFDGYKFGRGLSTYL